MTPSDLDGSDETGEGYFASVSDLMVGILFVFLLMLTVFALNFKDQGEIELKKYNEKKQEAETEKKLAQIETNRAEEETKRANDENKRADHERDEAEKKQQDNARLKKLLQDAADKLERDAEERQTARRRLIESLEETLRGKKIEVIADSDAGLLHVSGDLLFDSG